AMGSTMACVLRAIRSSASLPAHTSRKRWLSSATSPDSAEMKEAARAAPANLDGVSTIPMPPLVRYLDQDGELLEDQPMSDEMALEGYRVMLRGRRFDARCVS